MSDVTKLSFKLHEAQQAIYNSLARFKVVAAGRRFGKTWLAIVKCIVWGLRTHNDYGDPLDESSEVVYIGTTLEQARRNAWNLLKTIAGPVIAKDKNNRPLIHENTSVITLINGVRIRLLGMDNPDAARGMKLRAAVLDEYAQMPEFAWPEIIRPALIDTRGWALFIGTPKGRNHFYELCESVKHGERGDLWEFFNYSSVRNTFLKPEELASVAEELTRGSKHLYSQEIDAVFVEPGGNILLREYFTPMAQEPEDGHYVIACDLGGFSQEPGRKLSEIKQRDDHAIAIVKVFPMPGGAKQMAYGWWIKEIYFGKWGVRETAFNIVKAANDNKCPVVGIEKGIAKNAVMDYLREYMNEYNVCIDIQDLSHGNRNKLDRIRWALEGRGQKGRLFYRPDRPWNEPFLDQATSFPSRLVHDDLIDAVAYVDQLSENMFYDMGYVNSLRFEPLDPTAGY